MAKEKENNVNAAKVSKFYTAPTVPFVGDTVPKFKAAAVQMAPVFLDREKTIDKIAAKVAEAKANGADLVGFSESVIPTFPHWCLFLPPVDQWPFYKRLWENSIEIGSPSFKRLANIARENKVFLSVGFCEKSSDTFGTMWNSMAIFDRDGNMIQHHRKIMPTWAEKLVWAAGDGSSLNVHKTELGNIGGLICGENGNTLALNALGSQGEQVHLALYPAIWPTMRANATYEDCLLVRTKSQSFQSKMYSICCSACLDEDSIQQMSCGDEETADWLRNNSYACTCIVGPNGRLLTEVLGSNKEGIVYADIDLATEIVNKGIHDYYGAYQRFDIFQLHVNKAPNKALYVYNDPHGEGEFIPYEDEAEEAE